jgi:putative tricarboxylic transport membrane protein
MADGGQTSANGSGFQFKIRAPREFWGGMVMVAIALIAFYASRDLSGMEGFQFGAGTAPRIAASLLALIGLWVAVSGLLADGPTIERYAIRGPLLVVVSILGFAVMIRSFGLVVTTYLTFMIAIFGSREMRLIESLIAAAAMTAFCVLIFHYLLELPFDLWPTVLN